MEEQSLKSRTRKRFCLRGHDTFECGRTACSTCKLCHKAANKKWKKTEAGKASKNRWNRTENGKAARRKYARSEKGRALNRSAWHVKKLDPDYIRIWRNHKRSERGKMLSNLSKQRSHARKKWLMENGGL